MADAGVVGHGPVGRASVATAAPSALSHACVSVHTDG